MSYVFLPPRTTNFYPPGPPYLAGFRGLGDYAADLAAYQHDHDLWVGEKATYDQAMAAWKSRTKALLASYTQKLANYKSALATWNTDYQTYLQAVDAYNTQYAGIKRDNTSRSLAYAKSYGLTLPQSYFDAGACLTQAQHDDYASHCSTVKGLGSLDQNCGYAKLPICNYPAQPTMRPKPTEPKKPSYPAQPTLRAEPQAPTPPASTTPSTSSGGGGGGGGGGGDTPVTTTGPITTAPPQKQANVVMGGLIAVAILGGGYLVYRTLKKPKAQAA